MSTQERQMTLEESKAKAENEASSVQNRATLMREVRKIQNEGFIDKEIEGIFPESKGMLNH